MAIPDSIIEKIRDKLDIVEIISGYIPLKKIGRNYKTTCPFHHEKTPSFIVSPDKQIYHCFGCGAGGNVFSFVMKHENLQFPEAVEILAKSAGLILPRSAAYRQETDSFSSKLYGINELACQFFQSSLANSAPAGEYLASRGIGEETIKKLKIGYAPQGWDGLINFLRSKGLDAPIMEKAGLVIPSDKGQGCYDRFRNRIIFPIIDLKERILGFGARVLDASLPKYINSPETPIYSKGKNLYGLNFSKDAIKKEGYALIVEGYLDFIIPFQAGIRNIIATLGTALTPDHIKLLRRFANTVIIAYDPDEAGESASLRSLDLLISEDMNVYIAELASGFDPDGYIRKFGAEDFLTLVKSSKNIFDYKLDKLKVRFDMTSTHGKAAIAGEMLPTIARIDNAVLKADLVKKLSERLGVDEEALKTELKKVRPDYIQRQRLIAPAPEVKKDLKTAEMMILALLFAGESFVARIHDRMTAEEFRSASIQEIVKAVFGLHSRSVAVSPAALISRLGNNDDAASLISEAVSLLDIMGDKDKTLDDCVDKVKKDNVKDHLKRLQDEIRSAHDRKDDDTVRKLVAQYNDLVKADKR